MLDRVLVTVVVCETALALCHVAVQPIKMTSAIQYGVDLCAPPPELTDRIDLLKRLGASLLVSPLAHPRYRRDHLRPLDEPMTRSDLVVNSNTWNKHIVGKLSPWLQLDSPHAHIRRRSEEAFKQEVAWAAHLGLSALMLPPPTPDCPNYVRLVQWACASTQHMKFLVRVPIAADEADEDDGAKEHSMRLIYKHKDYTVQTGGSLDGGRGGSNVPWGVKLTKVPVLKEAEIAAARAHFKKAIEAFGLREAGEAAWHLVTVADGG